MKRLIKTITTATAAFVLSGTLAGSAFAAGSYSVDNTHLILHPGESATVTVSADNAAGKVVWDSEGTVTAVGSGWIESNSDVASISVYANQAGTGYITVYPDPESGIATFDEEMLDYGYTITVEVVDDNAGIVDDTITDANDIEEPANNAVADNPDDNAQDQPADPEPAQDVQPDNNVQDQAQDQAQEQDAQEPQGNPADNEGQDNDAAQAAEGVVLTDGNDDYSNLSEEDRLYTTVDGQELYIIQYPLWSDENGGTVWNDEIKNLDRLNGFEYKTVKYKEINVDTFQNNGLIVFVLKNLETDVSRYYVLKENAGGFAPLPYVTVNGRQYIVEQFPADFEVPAGYQIVEMTLSDSTVQALKQTSDVSLKGYEAVVSPGLNSTDPTPDIYYIYCMVDGQTQLYAYDSGEGTLQRASILVYNEIPTEPEAVIQQPETFAEQQTQPEPPQAQTEQNSSSLLKGIGWNGMQIQIKVLLVAFVVAIILLIILIIAFAAMARKNKKNRKKGNSKKNNRSKKIPPRDSIPPRTSSTDRGRKAPEDDSIFSYVKTESEDFDINDLK